MTIAQLTDDEKKVAARFKSIWQDRKGIGSCPPSQEDFAQALGLSQPALSQMLNGKMKIPLPIFARIGKVLNIDPVEIDPNYRNKVTKRERSTSLVGTFSGALPDPTVRVDADMDGCSFIQIDKEISVLAPIGSIMAVNQKAEIKEGDKVYARLDNGLCLLGVFAEGGDAIAIKEVTSSEYQLYNKSQILSISKVVAIMY